MQQQLARLALDDARLSQIRGGYDVGSGVTVNFAFQQATYVNNNLTESIVTPTFTVSPGQTGFTTTPTSVMAPSATTATVVANGTVQTQVSVSNSVLQALVNSGMATVVGGTVNGNGGVTTTIANTANNQLIQQMTTVDIAVGGLSGMLQQSIASTVLNRLAGPGVSH